MFLPSKIISPPVGSSSKFKHLKNVDLLDNKLSQFEISHNEETKIIK